MLTPDPEPGIWRLCPCEAFLQKAVEYPVYLVCCLISEIEKWQKPDKTPGGCIYPFALDDTKYHSFHVIVYGINILTTLPLGVTQRILSTRTRTVYIILGSVFGINIKCFLKRKKQ